MYEPGCEYAIYQRQSVLKEEWDEWEILLDANQRAAKSEFYTGGLGIAPNNQLMAVAEDYLSRRQYGLRFLRPQQRRVVPGNPRKCHLRLCTEQRFTLCLVCA